MEYEKMYKVGGGILVIDFKCPAISIYRNYEEARSDAGECAIYFDEEGEGSLEELDELIKLLEKYRTRLFVKT